MKLPVYRSGRISSLYQLLAAAEAASFAVLPYDASANANSLRHQRLSSRILAGLIPYAITVDGPGPRRGPGSGDWRNAVASPGIIARLGASWLGTLVARMQAAAARSPLAVGLRAVRPPVRALVHSCGISCDWRWRWVHPGWQLELAGLHAAAVWDETCVPQSTRTLIIALLSDCTEPQPRAS